MSEERRPGYRPELVIEPGMVGIRLVGQQVICGPELERVVRAWLENSEGLADLAEFVGVEEMEGGDEGRRRNDRG